ncbi:MAG: adenine DNA glycosylase [Candidatus Westeberhardia cardiocondylae]|nr:adenine DNA glycosylase [Candidatus Westeberhardia cardiocondylae]
MHIFVEEIIFWYKYNGRSFLPWRLDKDPYKIWLSEIMLQQTHVTTVIPYFKKFLNRFPTILQLSESSLDTILYLWSGLGYYVRARNLYYTAKIVSEWYFGKFPSDFGIIITFPGIGRSTAGAILSIAFNKCYSILDANVKRILMRYFNISAIFHVNKLEKILWSLIEYLTPKNFVAEFNQAIMDFGALVCTSRDPKCFFCPIRNSCLFYLRVYIGKLHVCNKSVKKVLLVRCVWFLVLQKKNLVWLEKRFMTKFWKELFCFPEFSSLKKLLFFLKNLGLMMHKFQCMRSVKYNISNFILKMNFVQLKLDSSVKIDMRNMNYGVWYNLQCPQSVGISSPIFRWLSKIYRETVSNVENV